MVPFELDQAQIRRARDQMLEHIRLQLDPVTFVILRNTTKQIFDRAIAENDQFERALQTGDDLFVKDVSSSDPVAFIIRGTLHLEEKIGEIIQALQLRVRGNTLEKQIDALDASGRFTADDIALLHTVRKLRNTAAHNLSKGRAVDTEVAQALTAQLSSRQRILLTRTLQQDPVQLPPEMVVKATLNFAYHVLTGFLSSHAISSEITRVMQLSVGFRAR